MNPDFVWTPEKDAFLRKWLKYCRVRFCVVRLGCTEAQVLARGRTLGLVEVQGKRRGKWTDRDDRICAAAAKEAARLTGFRTGAVIERMMKLNANEALEILDIEESVFIP